MITGSHGGVYSAAIASQIAPKGIIFNDAGVGLDEAGIAGLALLNEINIPAATVDSWTARIGDAADIFDRGIISHVNDAAFDMGVRAGRRCNEITGMLGKSHAAPTGSIDVPVESRRQVNIDLVSPVIWALDSASLVTPEDAYTIVITGSHGGLIGGDPVRALAVDALMVIFNDAGVGIDQAGISRLTVLDRRNIGAITVSHKSARIGCAYSSWENGCISFANVTATEAGVQTGQPLNEFLYEFAQRNNVQAEGERPPNVGRE